MQGYAKEICRTWFFVGLRIEVDAPGVLAAIRPCHSLIWSMKSSMNLRVQSPICTRRKISSADLGGRWMRLPASPPHCPPPPPPSPLKDPTFPILHFLFLVKICVIGGLIARFALSRDADLSRIFYPLTSDNVRGRTSRKDIDEVTFSGISSRRKYYVTSPESRRIPQNPNIPQN